MIQLLTAECVQWSNRTTGHSYHVQRLPQAITSDAIHSILTWHNTIILNIAQAAARNQWPDTQWRLYTMTV